MSEHVWGNLRKLIEFYQSLGDEILYNNGHHYNGSSDTMVYSRLERACFNQAEDNAPATCFDTLFGRLM